MRAFHVILLIFRKIITEKNQFENNEIRVCRDLVVYYSSKTKSNICQKTVIVKSNLHRIPHL